ncbi:hypothetical protein D3C87_1769910 [compost metagenome]
MFDAAFASIAMSAARTKRVARATSGALVTFPGTAFPSGIRAIIPKLQINRNSEFKESSWNKGRHAGTPKGASLLSFWSTQAHNSNSETSSTLITWST